MNNRAILCFWIIKIRQNNKAKEFVNFGDIFMGISLKSSISRFSKREGIVLTPC